jgi:hypothetical protein
MIGARGLVPVLLLVAACVPIHLVSDYDEATDQQVSALQRFIDDSLVALKGMPAPLCLHANHLAFYASAYSSVRSLQMRNEARGKLNQPTTDQIGLLMGNVQTLEQLHEAASNKTSPTCMLPEAIEADRSGFDTVFRAILTLELAKKRGASPDTH